MKKSVVIILAFIVMAIGGYTIKKYFDNKKEKEELRFCQNKFVNMKKDATIIKDAATLILGDFEFSMKNCYQGKQIWGNIVIPDSVNMLEMSKLNGFFVTAYSMDECLFYRKSQYVSDGGIKKMMKMQEQFKKDFEIIKNKKKPSLKEICVKFDSIEEDIDIIMNDIISPLANPFAGVLWAQHIDKLNKDLKSTDYDVELLDYSNTKELENVFKFMSKYRFLLQMESYYMNN